LAGVVKVAINKYQIKNKRCKKTFQNRSANQQKKVLESKHLKEINGFLIEKMK
jgi:hypothetical protein